MRRRKGTGRTKGDVGGAGPAGWTRFCSPPPPPCCSPSFSSSPPASAAKPGKVSRGAERICRASLALPRPIPVGAALLLTESARAGGGGARFSRAARGRCAAGGPRGEPAMLGGAGILGGPEGFWGYSGKVLTLPFVQAAPQAAGWGRRGLVRGAGLDVRVLCPGFSRGLWDWEGVPEVPVNEGGMENKPRRCRWRSVLRGDPQGSVLGVCRFFSGYLDKGVDALSASSLMRQNNARPISQRVVLPFRGTGERGREKLSAIHLSAVEGPGSGEKQP